MTSPLTILLPLKGRHLHTLRFLFHADRAKLPYHFLIADGEVHPAIARILENPKAAFPNLDIEYIRYPNDASYSDFYRKMADASARVRTPYVMQADNDDFLVGSGIELCLKFLDEHPDYVACGGGVGGFVLNPSPDPQFDLVVGSLNRVMPYFMEQYCPREDADPSVANRILEGFRTLHTTYYCVLRTQALATILHEIAQLDMTDLHVHEVYFGARALSLGKARRDGTVVSYMRQGATATTSNFRTNWAKHLVESRLTSDLAAVVDRIDFVAANGDSRASAEFKSRFRTLFGEKLREVLEEHYRTPKPVKVPASSRLKAIVRRLLPKPVTNRIQRDRSRNHVFATLRAQGASGGDVAGFHREWTQIEEVFSGPAFSAFVRTQAPELVFGASAVAAA